MAMLESSSPFPDGSMDQEDAVYPCKGCGEILEEGKAFELAGNRWHIDCFRCNTCGTLLDSDANLLLLGDGSLICNNCTYSCSACHNKIEDLAILTGDQAFCANCFRCRNCKRKIDNLRYARTSQGIFCMSCHESLMARRRKNKKAPRAPAPSSNGLNKSLPSLPPGDIPPGAFSPDMDTPSDTLVDSIYSAGTSARNSKTRQDERPSLSRDISSPALDNSRRTTADDQILLPASTFQGPSNDRTSSNSKTLSYADNGADLFGSVPFMLDPQDTPDEASPPTRSGDFSDTASRHSNLRADNRGSSRDYFGRGPTGQSGRDSSTRELYQDPSRLSAQTHRNSQSPHIAYQQKDRKPSDHIADTMRRRKDEPAAVASPEPHPTPSSEANGFKLQEAPKQRKSSTSHGSRNEKTSSTATVGRENLDPSPRLVERISYVSDDYPSPEVLSPRLHKEMPLTERPRRGDSLAAVQRKGIGSAGTSGPTTPTGPASNDRSGASTAQGQNGSRTVTKTLTESPESRLQMEPPPRAPSRPNMTMNSAGDVFTAPRAAPPAPSSQHRPTASSSTVQSANSGGLKSPQLPRSSTGADFSMAEEMERIIQGNETREKEGEAGMLRKMSNAVKHGRSFSDRAPRSERSSQSNKWPRSPLNGSVDLSSPGGAVSPNAHEENILLKNRLRQAQERIAKLEMEKSGLLNTVSNNVDLSQVNTELKEKRSTMAFLDTQRELVVRELEVMTEHLRKAKEGNRPLDVNEVKAGVTRDFASSLQKLKDTLGKQIEELMQKRNELTGEIDNLIQMKDKGFQEYEALSSRNHQLNQHNHELLNNIQSKNGHHNGVGSLDATKGNGLGLYIQPNKQGSRYDANDLSSLLQGGTDFPQSGSMVDNDMDSTVVATPQVVKIGKGKPNMLKKGTQGFVKGLRNMRGQLQERSDRSAERNNSMPYSLEGMPYNQMSQGQESNGQLAQRITPDASSGQRQKFGFFGERPDKAHLKHLKSGHNGSNPSLASDSTGSANLVFGTELTNRCEFEKRVIPSIVSRCIEEVELRGMDVEGIYRKSGGTGQVNQIRAGFEKDNDFDISDPDLDIHAVTSALKQYLRKLPTPLVTYEVYEKLLDCARMEDHDSRALPMKDAINSLPKSHKDCLEFLVFHLAKVMAQEKDNLMTPLNLAVVFAPTIMRPLSIEREMTDMQLQRIAVQSILEMNQIIFGYDA